MSKGQGNVKETRKVEVFRPGTFRAMDGRNYSFSETDLSAMVDGYDADAAPAPVVVGHPTADAPAFGWATGFEVNDAGVLVAELGELAPEFVSAVEGGRYRKISMKFFPPEASNNPKPGTYYPRHIGFLGGAAPAVSGLAPVQFADAGEDDLVEIAFSLPELAESSGSIFRRIREFLIEKYGKEAADEAVPEYHIRWIEEAGKEPEPLINPGFSQNEEPQEEEESAMPDDDKLREREAAIAARERALAHAENVSFADGLINDGKLLPVNKDSAVALLDHLSASDEATEIAFSDDGSEKKSAPLQLFKDILTAQPQIVPLDKMDLGDAPSDRAPSFAAVDGHTADAGDLEIHAKAKAFQAQNPGTDFLSAVAAVSEG